MSRRLLALLLLGAWPAAHADPPPPSVATELQPFVDSHTLAGAVTLIANKEKVLSVETVGYADLAGQKPMPANALFWIASMSKPITATALMMLVDEGKVNVDDPVEKYLPEFKGQWLRGEKDATHQTLIKPKHPILVRNILSHTSGLAFRSVIEQPTLDLLPLRTAVLSYTVEPLQFEPDTQYQYSNEGLNVAGRIIEVVSRMPYETFLQKRLFDPLGMKDTTFWPNEEQVRRLAKSYKPTADKTNLEELKISQLLYPLSDRRRQPIPAGGLFSTAADVGRFCQMLLRGGEQSGRRYLSEKALAQMTSRQTAPELKTSYGFGWTVSGTSFGHGGAYSTNMNVDPERGLVTIFMVQHAGWPNGGGGPVQAAFLKEALREFGQP